MEKEEISQITRETKSFDVYIATKYGVLEAIILNEVMNIHTYKCNILGTDNCSVFYNDMNVITNIFKYIPKQTLLNILDKFVRHNILEIKDTFGRESYFITQRTIDILSGNQPVKKTKNIKTEEEKKNNDSMFESCWIAYRRKGSKHKSKTYWDKLTEEEKLQAQKHIQSYIETRGIQYQKDFERYLRDKVFNDVIVNNDGEIMFNPEQDVSKYTPKKSIDILYNNTYDYYMYLGINYDNINDGYNDETRPNGATLILSNGRGKLVWKSVTNKWFLE